MEQVIILLVNKWSNFWWAGNRIFDFFWILWPYIFTRKVFRIATQKLSRNCLLKILSLTVFTTAYFDLLETCASYCFCFRKAYIGWIIFIIITDSRPIVQIKRFILKQCSTEETIFDLWLCQLIYMQIYSSCNFMISSTW